MMPPGTRSARRARCSPTRRLSVSSSSWQGPAIRKSASVGKSDATSVRRLDVSTALALGDALRLAQRGGDEAGEQRVWTRRTRLELRVELAADEVRVRRELHHLDERPVGREA